MNAILNFLHHRQIPVNHQSVGLANRYLRAVQRYKGLKESAPDVMPALVVANLNSLESQLNVLIPESLQKAA